MEEQNLLNQSPDQSSEITHSATTIESAIKLAAPVYADPKALIRKPAVEPTPEPIGNTTRTPQEEAERNEFIQKVCNLDLPMLDARNSDMMINGLNKIRILNEEIYLLKRLLSEEKRSRSNDISSMILFMLIIFFPIFLVVGVSDTDGSLVQWLKILSFIVISLLAAILVMSYWQVRILRRTPNEPLSQIQCKQESGE
jgi:hypothetical protein